LSRSDSPPPGFLNINKPAGVTAHDVVASVRRIIRAKQVGHGGTLDPMATGVLPIAVGKSTRLLRFLSGDKTYLAGILLGRRTTTDDVEGETLEECANLPDAEAAKKALLTFTGTFQQVPPNYSAIHIDGKRLYELARSGNVPENIPSRSVTVHSLQIISVDLPSITARISCSAGTYIRSIARDLGDALGCGGCLQSLVRENAGPFSIAQSLTLEELQTRISESGIDSALIPPTAALSLRIVEISEEQRDALCKGQPIIIPEAAEKLPACPDQSDAIAATLRGELVAVCRESGGGRLQPEVVIANADRAN
jgi:tRNA pseudouridine55 synthase